MLKRTALCSVFVLLPQWLAADEIRLKNGDFLKGEVVTLKDDKLIFNSPVLGKLEIAMDNISSFSTEQPVELHLETGEVMNARLESAAPAGFIQPTGQGSALALRQLSEINPVPEPPVAWKGKLFAGLNIETGNTKAQDIDFDVKTTRETKLNRMIFTMHFEEDRRNDELTDELVTSKRHYTLGGHYDYFLSPIHYLYADGKAEREATADLDERLVLGSGGGYRWVETPETRFEVESGLSWVSESFTDTTSDNSYAALRAASRLTHKLTSDLDLSNDLEWLASLANSADQLVSMDTGLAYQVNGHLSLEARLHYDWNKSPALGNEKEDLRYVLGASWGF